MRVISKSSWSTGTAYAKGATITANGYVYAATVAGISGPSQPAFPVKIDKQGMGSVGALSGSNNLWYSERTPRSTAPATSFGIIANPRFVSATNYHLQKGGPAIGAGIPFEGLTRDFDAVSRLNPPSIGAFE